MLKVASSQHGEGVCLQIVRRRGAGWKGEETVTVCLTPEAARMLGVGLIEDAAAADCYRREMADPADEGRVDGEARREGGPA